MLINFVFIFFSFMGYLAGQDVEYLQSEEFKQINMPFSEAVRVGNLLFLS